MILLEIGVTPTKSSDVMVWILLALVTFLLYIFRNNLIIAPIWRAYKIFWFVLGAILLGNYAKKSIKAWWEKD
jgi:Kef-type K+ transport system membrane component KefB